MYYGGIGDGTADISTYKEDETVCWRRGVRCARIQGEELRIGDVFNVGHLDYRSDNVLVEWLGLG